MASPDVCWQILRAQSCHIIKKNQCPKWFSSDPLNPKNIHIKKFSGLSQRNALSVKAHPSGKGVLVIAKNRNFRLGKPAKGLKEIPLTKHVRKINKSLDGLAKSAGRSDLQLTLKRRATALIRAQRKLKGKKPASPAKEEK